MPGGTPRGGCGCSQAREQGLWVPDPLGRTNNNTQGYHPTESCCPTVLKPHGNPEKGLLSSPVFRQGNRTSERLSVLAEVTQREVAQTWVCVLLHACPMLSQVRMSPLSISSL